MKQPDPLQLVKPGTLAPPGPIGRIVRILIGIACLYALYQLVIYRDSIIAAPISHIVNISLMLIIPFLIINPVVNIGFGKNWGHWPTYIAVIGLATIAAASRVLTGGFDNEILGASLWLWLVYFYTHVGLSFTLAGLNATPGCEMRALPDLLGKLTGRPALEHHCPALSAGWTTGNGAGKDAETTSPTRGAQDWAIRPNYGPLPDESVVKAAQAARINYGTAPFIADYTQATASVWPGWSAMHQPPCRAVHIWSTLCRACESICHPS